ATTNATPYSFVAGIENASLTDNMPDDGIVVNHWLADDLQLSPGDAVELHYYAINAQNRLTETNHAFHVHAIVRITGEANDPSLMPAFPGLLDVDNCRDWDPGMPLDLKRVRDKDEAYWDNHRGTPKAFVTLPAARTMWSNRHGTATGVRFPYQADASVDLLADILMRLHPGDVGMRILPVLETGLRASRDGVSFGQLFIGLSFFLIVAALLLTGLLFAFGIEQRAEETGLLLALGMRAQAILRIRLLEGSCIAVPGALLGGALGILCNALVLQLLSGAWQTIVGTIPLQLRVLPTTLITGTACGALSAWIAMWLTARKQCIREPATLQRAAGRKTRCSRQSRTIALGFGVLCWGAVATIVFASGLHTAGGAAGIFFGAGAMALTGSLAITYAALDWIGARQTHGEFGLLDVALRGATRRPLHSLATVGLLATGAFLVIATGANRPGPPHDASDPASGTGGFELFAESSIPIFENLQTPSGRKTLGIGPDLDIEILPLRCFEGDDASCLNLNRVTQPTVLGVAPEALVGRFAFAGILSELATDHPWDALDAPVQSNVIPAVADQSTVLWGLGKKLGDGLPVEDGRGNPVELQFLAGTANSVLQGYVLISESNFVTRFPYTAGYRIFLIDVNSGTPQVVAQELSRLLANYGFEITPTPARLAAFAAIQDTYLSIFMSLGALALLLGSAGVGVVVARNIMERRAELAMLGALGFARRTLYLILLIEHTALFTIGLAAGSAAGWVAVLHALKSQGTPVSLAALAGLLALLLANGLLWITTAVALATRGPLLPALRQE
ncbi:MAG: ABC transporter permease, partial [Verrucomicrobia bacterium]|nr:ABC transporter permease [Verrucomicrobiota bacterium]